MEVVVALLVVGVPLGVVGSCLGADRGGPLAGLFPGDQALGWPHGVQEEDPPTGWSWRLPPAGWSDRRPPGEATIEPVEDEPVDWRPQRVAPRVARGTSRRASRW